MKVCKRPPQRLFRKLGMFLVFFLVGAANALAAQAQPVPIPEDPSISPQINISGVGIGTLGYQKNAEMAAGKGVVDLSDSSLQVGGAQKLLEGGIGSFELGWLTLDETNKASSSPYFLHQAFVDYQDEKHELLIGRSDNLTAHLIDFPTLRGDDLLTFANPLNPLSNGKNSEEHRYANVASFTYNHNLQYFENIHAQHLINSRDAQADAGLNSFGASLQYLGSPGLESFELIPAWAVGVEKINVESKTANSIQHAILGAVINLNESVINRVELSLQDIYSWGSDLTEFASTSDSFEADSNAVAASIRLLHAPFGRPAYQIAVTTGYKTYKKVGDAISYGYAVTGVKRLGHGFDFVAQYEAQWRGPKLAASQSGGLGHEDKAEIGFAFNFDATVNEHLAPRRSLLNQQHHFLSE